MSDPTPEWKKFEHLAADIQSQLAPEARVQTNVKLVGKRTGVERQIDILVEQEVGQYEIRIVIDCKDYKNPVDVKDIEMFMGLVEDVGANKGAIVSASGFTSTAKKRAHDAGIDIYRLVDTNQTKWKTYISLPCVIRDRFIKTFNLSFSAVGYVRFPTEVLVNPAHMPVYRADGTLMDYAQNLVLERWENRDIPNVPGVYRNVAAMKEETFMKVENSLYKVSIEINATVAERLYFGQVPLEDTRGFSDEQTGLYTTNAMTTAEIVFDDVEKNWEHISSIEQLAIKPVLVLTMTSRPQRFNGSPP